jgi:hypothetical protein
VEEAKELLRLAQERCEAPGITYAKGVLAFAEERVKHYESVRDARAADARNTASNNTNVNDAANINKD